MDPTVKPIRRATLMASTFALASLCSCVEAHALKRSAGAGFKASTNVAYTITKTLPHDTEAFTEGLELCDASMIESVGLYGRSALIRRAMETQTVVDRRSLPGDVFGEGVTCFGDRIYQLTWRSQIAYVYDHALHEITRLRYQGEGWGLTHNADQLIMSNGSDVISFRDPQDFHVIRTIAVRDGDTPVFKLNELEYANGMIFANVWETDRIAIIDAGNGQVRGWLDLAGLDARFKKPTHWDPADDVLNGIAHDAARDRWYVTGKRWPLMFELKLKDVPSPAAGGAP
ncbi:glutaminyl-peptide cyclotransferase [Solimonas marina]|uniref:Glutaminyl-peptide cyclotransferase n=1 Tax=Solimonas marina TaxID=2714601 RepID=A0A970B621_9GAMM|nr:glutaminyl-peptide cyclotransferase [Solimonas marina]NKF22190.1 glutaminyl-peptide cyclotransferase [Solimonas marina]